MARRMLTNKEIEQMGIDSPGSAAEWLRLRREELEAEAKVEAEKQDYARYEAEFVSNGGHKTAAKETYTRSRNEQAEQAARQADQEALAHARSVMISKL